nr:hypothetical protein [Pseudoxanthomonas sp.]
MTMRWMAMFLWTALAGGGEPPALAITGQVERFAPGVVSTSFSEIRLTLSPDGGTAIWFSRDRPGGAGGYDLWMSRRTGEGWSVPAPLPFNSAGRDFDPAFSADGRQLYFCSDRPGGLGGDDLYRVAVTGDGFGAVEWLGPTVNSAGNEFAPMLSPDGGRLLFSSDRAGGAGRQDLYLAARDGNGFAPAHGLPGSINTAADEFDATFLGDGATIVFSRAADLRRDRVDLYIAAAGPGGYAVGQRLADGVNHPRHDSYAPMLDWSQPDRLLFSGKRDEHGGMDVFRVAYALPATR